MSAVRVGFGIRDERVADWLSGFEPAVVAQFDWPSASGQVATYLAAVPPQHFDYLVTSIRCLVTVGEGVLVCHTPNDVHCLPGGRREAGESWEDTARREVYEETGWTVGAASTIGFIHFNFVTPLPADHPYPHPDLFQVVYGAQGIACAADGRRDTEGWELRTETAPRDDLERLGIPAGALAFVSRVPNARGG